MAPFFLLFYHLWLFLKTSEGLPGPGTGGEDALEQGAHPSRQRFALPQDEGVGGRDLNQVSPVTLVVPTRPANGAR